MTDTYELVDLMKWLQSKGIKFEIPSSYQKVMSGMYLKEDKFYELCDNYLYNTSEFDKNYNPFEEVKNSFRCPYCGGKLKNIWINEKELDISEELFECVECGQSIAKKYTLKDVE